MDKTSTHKFATTMIAVIAVGVAGGSALAGGLLAIDFETAVFSDQLRIDNPYWPLRPDDTPRIFTYIGETEDECVIDQISVAGATHLLTGAAPYTNVLAVEVVDTEWVFEDLGEVECTLDLLPNDSAIKEKTLDWYVQDDQDNVWYLGESSENFEDECGPYPGSGDPECLEGSWEAGVNGAPDGEEEVIGEAGIVVPGDEPIAGEPLTAGTFFMQEVAYEAEDMAKILKLNGRVSIEEGDFAGDYEDCRKVKEWTALEPGGSVEHKWYCHGPGLILIEGIGGGPTEVEVLVEISPTPPAP